MCVVMHVMDKERLTKRMYETEVENDILPITFSFSMLHSSTQLFLFTPFKPIAHAPQASKQRGECGLNTRLVDEAKHYVGECGKR